MKNLLYLVEFSWGKDLVTCLGYYVGCTNNLVLFVQKTTKGFFYINFLSILRYAF